MNAPLNRAKRVDAEVVAAVATHLGALAATMTPRECALLVAALRRGMLPLDRMKERDPGEVLSNEERRVLDALVAGARGGEGKVAP